MAIAALPWSGACGRILRPFFSSAIGGRMVLQVGMDLVEVAPAYDHADITALAGATLAMEMLCLYAARHKVDRGQ